MRYAKLINGVVRYAPNPVIYGDNVVGNPPAEVYEALGCKPVILTEQPAVGAGCVAVPSWVETPEAIVQTWAVEPEPDEIDEGRAYRIITGEEE